MTVGMRLCVGMRRRRLGSFMRCGPALVRLRLGFCRGLAGVSVVWRSVYLLGV